MKTAKLTLIYHAEIPADMNTETFENLILKRLQQKDSESIRIWIDDYPTEAQAEPLFVLTSMKVKEE